MSVTFESFSVLNPNPNATSGYSFSLKKAALFPSSPSSIRFDPLLRHNHCRVLATSTVIPYSLTLHRRTSFTRFPFLAFATSREEPKHPEVEVGKERNDLKLGAEESQEAWKQALESFKEQALKIQSVSQEAYEIYSKKALVTLKETSEQLKIQAYKAKLDLNQIAKEISEESKEYISTAAENSPELVKEIVETFTSATDDFNDISRVHGFYLGVPYGLVLSLGGFLSFMVTGSVAAVRFGVILGCALLFLSILSLRSYKQGEASPLALKGQAAIAIIIFLREARLLAQRPSILSALTTFVTLFSAYLLSLISMVEWNWHLDDKVYTGAVVSFYLYRITLERKQKKGTDFENGAEN